MTLNRLTRIAALPGFLNSALRGLALRLPLLFLAVGSAGAAEAWLWSTAHVIPKETTSEGSGYFSLVEGHNGRLYIGTAKYRENAFLVEFDPGTGSMKVVVDCHRALGSAATGFVAQAKIHTRNNVGESGRIYFGTKQGYPKGDEKRTDYPGGHPMVYDPRTRETKVYGVPIPHHGIISIMPDERRGVAYLSTCDDARPIESSHFMILDLATGRYRDLLDCRHVYAFIVLDHLGRAYHPILGGDVARYDPRTDRLERLTQTIDGRPPGRESRLAEPESHPINWEVSPDRKTLYAVAMSANALYAYDLAGDGPVLRGRKVAALVPGAKSTDCRALAVGPDGTVWAGLVATLDKGEGYMRVVSYRPGAERCVDHGPMAVKNPEFTSFTGADGKELPWHHGYYRKNGVLVPRHGVLGICATRAGSVYVTTLYPFTLHEFRGLKPE
jgi:hypothetical protein